MITILITILITLCSAPSALLYWIKWCIAYLSVRYYSSKHKRRFDIYKPNAVGDPEKLGFLIPQFERELESPQPEGHLQKFSDEVMFYGINSEAECALIRLSRRSNWLADAWIYLRMADGVTYQLKETANYQHTEDEESMEFSCGSLRMQAVFPMRRWRIEYCGSLLRNSKNGKESQETVFVKFVFLWCASSDVYDVYDPSRDRKEFSHSLAAAEWKSVFPPIQQFLGAMNSYMQVGNLRGSISIEDKPEYEMYLFGDRQRNLGDRNVTASAGYPLIMGYIPQNGLGFHLQNNIKKNQSGIENGFVISSDGTLSSYEKSLVPFHEMSENSIKVSFSTVNGATYDLTGCQLGDVVTLKSSEGTSRISFLEFSLLNKKGYGIYFNSREIFDSSEKNDLPAVRTLRPKIVPLVVKFTDQLSQFGYISGGKGSSLGKLTKLSRQNKTFTVPKGIIVTTAAYEEFLNSDISRAIKELESAVYGSVEENKKNACERVIKVVLESDLTNKICDSIIKNLNAVFGDGFESIKFAVRSSATGEDTEVMSAAGQMDTFLAVQGLKNIFQAVKKCWASQFGLAAVEYKKQHGQLLNSPMAVVIQEMVACHVSGVMFTCDPVNNNTNYITITANYGLGETVVSGSVEPDTFVLRKNDDGTSTIKTMAIGSKQHKEIMNESGGTKLEELTADEKTTSCLSNDIAEKLGKLAIEVEKFYRSPRDIEWGIERDNIYLLQSRPVTSGSLVTDFELKHEFNTSLRCERDYFTIANVGEVLPGATPYLPVEMCTKLFAKAMQKFAFDRGMQEIFAKRVYCPADMFYQQAVMSVPELTCRHGHGTMLSKGMLISVFGRIPDEKEIYEIAKERFPHTMTPPLWVKLFIYKELLTYTRGLDEVKKEVESYDPPFLKYDNSQETFDGIVNSCSDFLDPTMRHIISSGNSSHWNAILFALLVKARGRIDAEVYSDFSKILATTTGVESADVPSSLQELANQIVKDVGATKFKNMSLEEAESWLRNSHTRSSELYKRFISRHGHRCLKEFDLHMLTWEEDQRSLITLLQASVGSTKEATKKPNKSYSELYSELDTPLSFWDRLLLRLIIPNCHKGVSCRETTKSISIKCIDYWRKGFRRLGQQMAEEGRIPEKDLIYFMMLDEIKLLLKTRDPKIIIRANQRRKIFPILQKCKLPELIRGYPKCDDEDLSHELSHASDLTMTGVPVSQGVVKGYARVATSLEQAASIKPGEVLIAFSTDIGWSPYFPIISGVVTELGGLISHGAVISREYGLPCVVGVQGATKKFKTGDYVYLDGKKGIIQRLPQPANSIEENVKSQS